MPYSVNVLKIEDFAKWKAEWEKNAEGRKKMGEKSHQVLRGIDDPSVLLITIEWESLDGPRQYAQSDEFKEVLRRAGSEHIDVYYAEEVACQCP